MDALPYEGRASMNRISQDCRFIFTTGSLALLYHEMFLPCYDASRRFSPDALQHT